MKILNNTNARTIESTFGKLRKFFGQKRFQEKDEIARLQKFLNQDSLLTKQTQEELFNESILQSEERLEFISQARKDLHDLMQHQMRTTITSIIGFSRALQMESMTGPLNDKQKRYVEILVDVGNYLLELLESMLDISQLETKEEELYLESVSIKEVCLSSLIQLQNQISEKGIKLQTKIAPDPSFCLADCYQTKQILVCLINNIINLSKQGTTLIVDVKTIRNMLAISISNTNLEIKSFNQEQILKPLCQGNQHKLRGKELKLAVSCLLAKLQGGEITFLQEERGSCFTLFLPRTLTADDNCSQSLSIQNKKLRKKWQVEV